MQITKTQTQEPPLKQFSISDEKSSTDFCLQTWRRIRALSFLEHEEALTNWPCGVVLYSLSDERSKYGGKKKL
jgi:hypothetical protein